MASFLNKTALFAGMGVFLMSCNTVFVDGESRNLSVQYEADKITRENGNLFQIGGDYGTSFRAAQNNLRNAGFSILNSDAQTGRIDVATNNNDAVSCGNLATGASDDLRVFAANTAHAALEVRDDSGGSTFVLRDVIVYSTAAISVGIDPARPGQTFASVQEQHQVQLIVRQASDNAIKYDETIEFSGQDAGVFRRGVKCGSGRTARAALTSN